MSPVPIVVDTAGLIVLAGQLSSAGERVGALPEPLRARSDAAVEGAGEFAGDLQHGAAVFALSWMAALHSYAECCSLLAGNVGASALQLDTLDADAASSLDAPR
ncbi:MAG TPA: hypothetical protein VFR07_19530 [Mycobacteriales bacterium]|jgi:hypothetical protein|nr:hypothetical protein [Mycobacteriales bacterium]